MCVRLSVRPSVRQEWALFFESMHSHVYGVKWSLWGVPIGSFCEGFNFETFTLNSRCGWLGGCVCTAGIFFWEHLELSNLEHITLGTLPIGPFFRFLKISNLTPPGQFLTFFWPTFLKAVAFFFGWSKSLAFLDLEAHGRSLGLPFWIFQKYAFLRPWRTSDGFSFW